MVHKKRTILRTIAAPAIAGLALVPLAAAPGYAQENTCTFFTGEATNRVWISEGPPCSSLARTGVDAEITETVFEFWVFTGARIGTAESHAPGTYVVLRNQNGGATQVRWHSNNTPDDDSVSFRGMNIGIPDGPMNEDLDTGAENEEGDLSSFAEDIDVDSSSLELLGEHEDASLWTAENEDGIWLIYENPESGITSATTLSEEEWEERSLTLHIGDTESETASEYFYVSESAGAGEEIADQATSEGLEEISPNLYVDPDSSLVSDDPEANEANYEHNSDSSNYMTRVSK